MHVNEWISYECSDEGPYTPNIRNSSTRHALDGRNRRRFRSKNYKCKRALTVSTFVFQDAVLNSGGINHIDSKFLVIPAYSVIFRHIP